MVYKIYLRNKKLKKSCIRKMGGSHCRLKTSRVLVIKKSSDG